MIRRVDPIEGSSIARGRGRPRKTIGTTFKNDLEANGVLYRQIYGRTL